MRSLRYSFYDFWVKDAIEVYPKFETFKIGHVDGGIVGTAVARDATRQSGPVCPRIRYK